MQGDKKVIEYLNQLLGNELVAINQYFLHSKMHKNWGFSQLADTLYKESIDEMKHADQLSDRILQLDGLPNFQQLGKIYIGETPKECLSCDLKIEAKAIPEFKEAIAYCESVKDFATRDLLTNILNSEEEHYDWIETQLKLIDTIGLENYLQSQI